MRLCVEYITIGCDDKSGTQLGHTYMIATRSNPRENEQTVCSNPLQYILVKSFEKCALHHTVVSAQLHDAPAGVMPEALNERVPTAYYFAYGLL